MYSLFLAGATELVYVGAAIAVLLLLIFQLRLMQRFRTLDLEVERLKKAHKDGTLDARSRVEEATQALEALEEKVAPRLEGIEPKLDQAELRLDEMGREVEALRPLVAQVEEAKAAGRGAADFVADAKGRVEKAEALAEAVSTRIGALEEGLTEARGRFSELEDGLTHVREAAARRLDEIEGEVAVLRKVALETTPPAGKNDGNGPSARSSSKGAAYDAGEEKVKPPTDVPIVTAAAIDGAASGDDVAVARTSPARERMAEPGPGLGLRGALIVVVAIAALVLVLRWLVLVG